MVGSGPGRRAQGNLPAEVTRFVGRVGQVGQARKLLASARLVTLVGVGGVGKTRLALRVGHEVAHVFSDGAWLASLADLPTTANTALVEQTVAAAFGLTNFSAERPREALLDHLRARHCLLVLDNCEHLVEPAGALVADLLNASPGLHVLATSREVLGCLGEHVVHVAPLSVPTDAAGPETEALELLRHCAASVGSPLSEADREAAGELCRRLDGLPLAIELAAGRLSTLSLAEVLERFDDRFRLLTGGARQGPAMHRTLRGVMDWSYHLCDEPQRLLWERASLFVGGFDLAAAEEVCSGHGIAADDVLDVLTGLVRQSILLVDHGGERARYRLLGTLRDYGLRALAARGAESEFRERHREYFHRVAARAGSDWFSPRQAALLERARTELPNLRAAMEYGLEAADADHSLRIAIHLAEIRVWFFLGWLGEGRAWLGRALAACPDAAIASRVTAMALAGWMSLCQGDETAAREYLDACTAIVDQTDSPPALRLLQGSYALLVECDSRSIEMLGRQVDAMSDPEKAMIELFWAMAAGLLGDRDTALDVSQQVLDRATRRQAAWLISWAQWAVGLAQMRHGDHDRALATTRESLRRQHEMGDRWGTVWGTYTVAWTLAAELRDQGKRGGRPDVRLAKKVAQVLGGATRLREWTGARLAGLGPFDAATTQAERTAREALGDQAYQQAFNQGSGSDSDRAEAYRRILALALDEPPANRTTAASDPAESDTATGELTAREHEIAALVAQGLSNPQIARGLVISQRTVQTHVANILAKCDLRNRQQIAVWYAPRNTHPR